MIAGEEGKPCQPPGIVKGIFFTYGYVCASSSIVVKNGCPEEIDPDFGIAWPSTMVNTNTTNNCPNGTGMI